jgi:molybdopterin synthase catalytic subunit
LTLSGMEDLAARTLERWPLAALLVIHRTGELAPGEPIVLVAVAAVRVAIPDWPARCPRDARRAWIR